MLGMQVEDVIRTGGVPGVVTARVRAHRAPSRRGQGPPRLGRRRRRRERHVWCGAFNCRAGDVVPLATLGTAMPDGRTIEARHPRHRLRGHALLGPRARARRRPHGHPRPARRTRRSACRTARRSAAATRSCSTSTSPATDPTAGRYIGVARDLAAKLGVPFRRRRRRRCRRRRSGATGDGRDRRRRALPAVHVDRAVRHRRRAVGAVDGRAADGGRHAADQQRRRRQQLRDARARPAEPRLRPRHARRRRVPHPPRPRGRDADDARRRRADADAPTTC